MVVVRAFIGVLLFTVTLFAEPAWAVQAHGGAEGLVAHQLGHLLFSFAMGYLLLRLYHLRQKGSGWTEFKLFLWLTLAWNVQTFSGHWLNESIPAEKFGQLNGELITFSVENGRDLVYYLTRLDHLLLVPAFLFLLLALRKWSRQS